MDKLGGDMKVAQPMEGCANLPRPTMLCRQRLRRELVCHIDHRVRLLQLATLGVADCEIVIADAEVCVVSPVRWADQGRWAPWRRQSPRPPATSARWRASSWRALPLWPQRPWPAPSHLPARRPAGGRHQGVDGADAVADGLLVRLGLGEAARDALLRHRSPSARAHAAPGWLPSPRTAAPPAEALLVVVVAGGVVVRDGEQRRAFDRTARRVSTAFSISLKHERASSGRPSCGCTMPARLKYSISRRASRKLDAAAAEAEADGCLRGSSRRRLAQQRAPPRA